MKLLFLFFVSVAVLLSVVTASSLRSFDSDDQMIFSGEVIEIGPSPGFGSGGVRAYQLVKYRVLDVCEGSFQGKEIIADHLILDPRELDNLKIGQRVCIGAKKAKKIAPRYDDEKIRKSTDHVEIFYIVHDIFIRHCQCSSASEVVR